MSGRRLLIYFAWSRSEEAAAPLSVIEDRFPALFELRRVSYPRYEALSDPDRFDQGIIGFLDHVQKPNFASFAERAQGWSGMPVAQIERENDDGARILISEQLLAGFDTIVILSFDSLRTEQAASASEVAALRRFLDDPDHVAFVCPHHDIGEAEGVRDEVVRDRLREVEHLHHGDPNIPPRQGFGGFARTLLAGLGVPVVNRFGLRPARLEDGLPAPIDADRALDDLGILEGVEKLNLHAHLPHLERRREAMERMQVLATQKIDPSAPPHPFSGTGATSFDALLQSAPATFAGRLYVCDATTFSSTAGGTDELARFWSNLILRPLRREGRSAPDAPA